MFVKRIGLFDPLTAIKFDIDWHVYLNIWKIKQVCLNDDMFS